MYNDSSITFYFLLFTFLNNRTLSPQVQPKSNQQGISNPYATPPQSFSNFQILIIVHFTFAEFCGFVNF